jgi:hypothetical protein
MPSSNTPSKADRASLSYSTPLQHVQPPTHNAVARLRGDVSHDRAAFTSQSSSSDSQESSSYTTPRSRRQSGSPAPALPGTPRTPSNSNIGTPSKRKGTVRIVRGPQKPWYDRCGYILLLFSMHLSLIYLYNTELQDCQSNSGTATSFN